MSEPPASDLDALAETWVIGWSRSRSMPVTREGRAWRVEVDSDKRSVEWVVARPSADDIGVLVSQVQATPRSWLTVLDGPADIPGLTPLAHGECLMRTTLRRGDASGVEVEERGGVGFATIGVDGAEAARGQIALAGTVAVVDRIGTEPEFRRRGFGRAIMAALTNWALDRGVTDGLLIASEEGVLLYTSLGWEPVAPISTFRGS